MKKWLKCFCLGFFSHQRAKESIKRGYTNVFLGFVLALALLCAGCIGAETLPFPVHYNRSAAFRETVHRVFANADTEKRIAAEILDGDLKVKLPNGDFAEGLLVNTFEREEDKDAYSVGGYQVVVDLRPADTLAEIEAYCLSNDGKATKISYEEYLTLSQVARLNFDFKIRYTGDALVLTEETVQGFADYLMGLGEEQKAKTEQLQKEWQEEKLTQPVYMRAVYELYFENYYPSIAAYESSSKVPLLRNYYYHEYIRAGESRYLFVFDDYLAGSFATEGGMEVSFYGFYSNTENGLLVKEGATTDGAEQAADQLIKSAFGANSFLLVYAHVINMISFIPFIALMLLVVTLLAYSLLKLQGVDSISSLGAMCKAVGSFLWCAGAFAAVGAVVLAFFVGRNLMTTLPLVLFFVILMARAILFVVKENQLYTRQKEQQPQQSEV